MGTPLQHVYDRFFSKIDEDLTGKEGQIFSLLDSAISKSYKAVVHSLHYILDDPIPPETESYDGNFIDILDSDEIELLSLWMLYEWNRKKQQKLRGQRTQIGTKDFNKIEDKAKELKEVTGIMKDIKEEINELKSEFNTYKYK